MTTKNFTQNPAAGPITGTEIVPGVQSGVDVKFTLAAILAKAWSRAAHTGEQAIASITGLQAALDSKALDSVVAKLTGNQTIAGTKTFSSAPVVPDGSWTIAKTTGLQAAIDGAATSVVLVAAPGGVDDTALVTAARSAAGVGGTVVFGPGTYVVTGLAASVADQRWDVRPGAVIKTKNGANTPTIDVTANGVTIDGGGTIDGNRTNQTSTTIGYSGLGTTACVRIISRSNVTVRGLVIKSGGSNGVLIDASSNVTLSGNRISDCSPTGNSKQVQVVDVVGSSTNLWITGNNIDAHSRTNGCIGVSITTSGRSVNRLRVVDNVLLVGNAGATATLGVELFTATGGAITDSTIALNVIAGPSGVVAASQVFGVSVGGVATSSSNGDTLVTVTGNTVRNCPSSSIEVIGRDVVVTGNTVINSGPITVLAIAVVGGISGVSVTGNTVLSSIDLSYVFRIHGGTNGIYGLVLSNNSVRGTTSGSVILVEGVIDGAVISGNTMSDVNGGPGMSLLGTITDSVIEGNVIDLTGVGGSTFDGILLSSTTIDGLGINDNTIRGASRHGIYGLLSCSDVSIVGNRITNCTSSGIQADNAQTRWTVVGNTTSNNGTYGIAFAVAAVNLSLSSNTSHTNTTANYLITGSTFLSHVVNGMDSALVPSGGDDTAQIAAAALAPGGVLLGPGLFTASTVLLRTGLRIQGAGEGVTTLKLKNATNADFISNPVGSISDVHISDLTIDGNKANQTVASPCITFPLVTHSSIRRVTVKNAEGRGIKLYLGSDIEVSDCTLVDCGATDTIDGTNSPLWALGVERLKITGNTVTGGRDSGILATECVDTVIADNVVTTCFFIGIALGSGAGTGYTVTGNVVKNCQGNGIDTGTATNVSVIGNRIIDCFDGIDADLSSLVPATVAALTIADNTIHSSANYGIVVLGPTAKVTLVTISGNTVNDSQLHGISVIDVHSSTITGNAVRNASRSTAGFSGIALNGCQDVVVTANKATEVGTSLMYGIDRATGTNNYNIYANNNTRTCSAAIVGSAGANDVTVNNIA